MKPKTSPRSGGWEGLQGSRARQGKEKRGGAEAEGLDWGGGGPAIATPGPRNVPTLTKKKRNSKSDFFSFLKVYFKNMKRAKGGRKKMNCFPLKEAVSGRDKDFYIYIYNFIGFVCFLCFLYFKFFFFLAEI